MAIDVGNHGTVPGGWSIQYVIEAIPRSLGVNGSQDDYFGNPGLGAYPELSCSCPRNITKENLSIRRTGEQMAV